MLHSRPKVVALYSPDVGTRSHATSCTVPACRLLSQRGRFKPVLVTGSSIAPGENAHDHEHIALAVDFSRNDPARFRHLGPLGKPVRVIFRMANYWRHLKLLSQLLNTRPDINLVHFFDYEYVALSHFLRSCLPKDLKTVVTVYQSDYDRRELSFRTTYKRFVHSRFRAALLQANGIIVYGDFIKDRLIADMNFSEEVTRRIFVARYHPGDCVPTLGKMAARQKLGIPEDGKVLLVFGALRHDKRIDLMIQACADSKYRPFLIIAGSPWSLSEKTVRGWIRESHLEDRTLAHMRWIDENDIPLYFGAADLFLSAYDGDYVGQSGPLNMCRAFQLPAVVSDVGELGYYVRHTGVGLLAQPGDAASFAKRIDEYFGSEELQERLKQAINKAAGAFSWDYFVGQLEACYDHALDS